MPSRCCILAAVALIALMTPAMPARADESGDFVSTAILLPESREVLARGAVLCSVEVDERSFNLSPAMSWSQLVKLRGERQEPLFDFAFTFSRAVEERSRCRVRDLSVERLPISIVQQEDLLLAELKARETQIAADLRAKSVNLSTPPAQQNLFQLKNDEVLPKKGWSGMSIAVRNVALRFEDEGAMGHFYR